MRNSNIFDCHFFELPKNQSSKGNITAVNGLIEIPFNIKRVYYLYDIPGGEARGGHAHKNLKQFILAASGSFDLIIDDGRLKKTYNLNRPNQGVILQSGLWRELNNFSSGSICLVFASERYKESDYIRNYEDFLNFKSQK